MKIVADTNIYYYLGQDKSLFEKVKNEQICPTFINILELSKTKNLIDKEELVREAVRKIFHFKDYVIYEPPFIHIAQLYQDFEYDPVKEFGDFLEFTSRFAGGVTLDKSKAEDFRAWAEKISDGFMNGAEFANETVEKIRGNIEDKREHRAKDTLLLTAGFIDHLVKLTTKGQCSLMEQDLDKLELLIKTLDAFFKEMELSKMKMQPNDWFDFAILSYVRPGEKFWTREKRWLHLIKLAGCQDYLFDI